MLRAILASLRFFWSATAGHRLRPWRSPYLRWRMETFTGIPASRLVPGDFTRLAWRERAQMLRFFRWMAEIEKLSQGGKL